MKNGIYIYIPDAAMPDAAIPDAAIPDAAMHGNSCFPSNSPVRAHFTRQSIIGRFSALDL